MSNLLLINAEGPDKRVALVEHGSLVELHVERKTETGIVGSIHKGRVLRVLPGMQAAFVDIGLSKAAFLYAADVRDPSSDDRRVVYADRDDRVDHDDLPEEETVSHTPIQELVREGQEILVQVAKEPIGTKGARVTSYVSLAGRHLVLMPTVRHIGISRRIVDDAERQRLKQIVESFNEATGVIVRTVAEGQSETKLQADLQFLLRLWQEIQERGEQASAPALLYRDLDLILRSVRDLVSSHVDRVLVDDTKEFERIHSFISTFMPQYLGTLQLHSSHEPLFDAYGIEVEIDRALDRKVWLKSGGYLVIDQGEALTSIDVNTGRYVGRRNLEDTITKINLEAVKEVVTQLRLRNIGGIIVIDFIDMERESNRQKVWRALQDALAADRAKSNVLEISALGLVEMTRKRVRDSLGKQLMEGCPYCEGKGSVKSRLSVCYEVLREIRRQVTILPGATIIVCVHPEVADLLADAEHEHLVSLERRFSRQVLVEARSNFHLEQFEIHVSLS
jgi:ribonuclease G